MPSTGDATLDIQLPSLSIFAVTVELAEKKIHTYPNNLGLPFLSSFVATLSQPVSLSGWIWDGVENRPRLACAPNVFSLFCAVLPALD